MHVRMCLWHVEMISKTMSSKNMLIIDVDGKLELYENNTHTNNQSEICNSKVVMATTEDSEAGQQALGADSGLTGLDALRQAR